MATPNEIDISENSEDFDEEIPLAKHKSSATLRQLYTQPATLTGGKLKNYQIEGLSWLYKLY